MMAFLLPDVQQLNVFAFFFFQALELFLGNGQLPLNVGERLLTDLLLVAAVVKQCLEFELVHGWQVSMYPIDG